jgi:hypothetical protein
MYPSSVPMIVAQCERDRQGLLIGEQDDIEDWTIPLKRA